VSEEVVDISAPHLRLVSRPSQSHADSGGPGDTPSAPDYYVIQGYLAPEGHLVILRQPNASLGEPSHEPRLPKTDEVPAHPVYIEGSNVTTDYVDHGALEDQADPRYVDLMAEVEDPNPTHSV
jgi:hypothetical protein